MIYSQINDLIKSGQLNAAISLLRGESRKKKPELQARQFAELYRRLGNYSMALQYLRKTVYNHGEVNLRCPSEDILEYSLSLIQFGLHSEAKFLLENISLKNYTWLQAKGFISLKELDYLSAITYFSQSYLAPDATAYQKILARVNVTNAMLGAFQYNEAIDLADQVLKDLDENQYGFLIQYLNHIKAQAYAFKKKEREFRRCSALTFKNIQTSNIEDSNSADILEFLRGRFVAECVLKIKNEVSAKKIMQLARKLKNYHVMLEVKIMHDFTKNNFQFLKVNQYNRTGYFLAKRFDYLKIKTFSMQEYFANFQAFLPFKNKTTTMRKAYSLSLRSRTGLLKPGQIPSRLLELFLKNPQKLFPVTEIYENIYSTNVYFDPLKSPNLVHQAVKRLNRILENERIPVQITSENDRYQILAKGLLSVDFGPELSHTSEFIKICFENFQWGAFRCVDIAKKMKLSTRQVQNLILLDQEKLRKFKTGRQVFYQLI